MLRLLPVLLLLACDADGHSTSLSMGAVTSVPRGDADGDGWSGDYQAEIYTERCTGTCGATQSGFPVSFCDVGETDIEYLDVVQTDGLLEITLNDPISRYRGGVYQDGGMEAGGYATDLGSAVELAARLDGTFSDDTLLAEASSHVWGTVDGTAVDCWGTYTVTAVRY